MGDSILRFHLASEKKQDEVAEQNAPDLRSEAVLAGTKTLHEEAGDPMDDGPQAPFLRPEALR